MTSILNVSIDGITKQGKIINNLQFSPSMLDSNFSKYDYILFSPSVPISKKNIPNMAEPQQKKIPFFSLEIFNQLIQNVKEKRNLSNIQNNFNNSVIIDNIDLILNFIFSYGTQISLKGENYTIYNYTWNGRYEINQSNPRITMFIINIRLVIYPGTEIPFSEGLVLLCREKNRELKRNFYDLIGDPQYQLDKSVNKNIQINKNDENPIELKKSNIYNKNITNNQFA